MSEQWLLTPEEIEGYRLSLFWNSTHVENVAKAQDTKTAAAKDRECQERVNEVIRFEGVLKKEAIQAKLEGKWFSYEELQATVNEKLEQVFAEMTEGLEMGSIGGEVMGMTLREEVEQEWAKLHNLTAFEHKNCVGDKGKYLSVALALIRTKIGMIENPYKNPVMRLCFKQGAEALRELVEQDDGKVVCKCCGIENVMPHYKFSDEMSRRVQERGGQAKLEAIRTKIEAIENWHWGKGQLLETGWDGFESCRQAVKEVLDGTIL